MMKMNFWVIIMIGAITACNSSGSDNDFIVLNGDTLRIVKEYDLDGHLKVERMIDSDSLTQGIAKIFYEDGTLHAEISFNDNKKNGLEKSYYKNGEIQCIGLNSSGKQDRTWVWFYESGVVEQQTNFINGATHGEDITYYENGIVKIFRFYNFKELIYIREYDSSRHLIKEDGRTPLSITYNKNSFKKDEVYSMIILVGLLPDWDFSLEITDEKGKIIKKVNDKTGSEKTIWGNRIVVDKPVSDIGVYKWLVNITITDENNKKMQYSKVLEHTVASSLFPGESPA